MISNIKETEIKGRKLDRNRWILWCGCIAMIILAVGITVRNERLRLKEPVFLRNCSEIYLMDDEVDNSFHQQITLQYITNADDERNISAIWFEGHPEVNCYIIQGANGFGGGILYGTTTISNQTYGAYLLNEITLKLSVNEFVQDVDEINLSTAIIDYSDGTRQTVNLGTIFALPWSRREDIFEGLRGYGPTSDTTITYHYFLHGETKLVEIDSVLADAMGDQVKFRCDGYENEIQWNQTLAEPWVMPLDGKFTIEASFDPSSEKAYDTYCLRPEILTEQNGRQETSLIDTANFQIPLNDYWEILTYLKERGVFYE